MKSRCVSSMFGWVRKSTTLANVHMTARLRVGATVHTVGAWASHLEFDLELCGARGLVSVLSIAIFTVLHHNRWDGTVPYPSYNKCCTYLWETSVSYWDVHWWEVYPLLLYTTQLSSLQVLVRDVCSSSRCVAIVWRSASPAIPLPLYLCDTKWCIILSCMHAWIQ
jgi:hypothetical protein